MSTLVDSIRDLELHQWIALSHALFTCVLAGLIWTIQIVHYPLFAWVPSDAFTGSGSHEQPDSTGYEREHIRRITRVVAPLMLLELLAAIALVFLLPAVLRVPAIVALLALIAIWISTAAIQSPIHLKIAENPDRELIRKLVTTNWLRTMLWSMRAVFAIVLLPVVL